MKRSVALALALGAVWPAFGQSSGPAAEVAHRDEMARVSALLRVRWAGDLAAGRVADAVTEPSVVGGHILTPSIDVRRAPGVPAVQVVLNQGNVGAAYFSVGIVSPLGTRYYSSSGDGRLPAFTRELWNRTVDVRLRYPFGASLAGLYTAPGVWKVYLVQLVSRDGTVINYDAAQLAGLFPSLDVAVANDGTPDVVAPVIGVGRLMTPIVRVGGPWPFLVARLPVSDDLSGVAVVSVVAAGPGGTVTTQAVIDYPVLRGAANTYAELPPDLAVGTYTIQYLYACDVATNCTYVQGSAGIEAALGATAFQVID